MIPETLCTKSGPAHVAYQVVGDGPRDLKEGVSIRDFEAALSRFEERMRELGLIESTAPTCTLAWTTRYSSAGRISERSGTAHRPMAADP